MFVLVLRALCRTVFADLGTKPADIAGQLRVAGNQRRRRHTNRRAIPIEPDALDQMANVPLQETLGSTMFAFRGAADASFVARLMLLVSHATPRFGSKR
jgi:hypothetical protein